MNFTHEHLKNNVTMFLFGMSLLYQDLPTQKQTENINDDIRQCWAESKTLEYTLISLGRIVKFDC